MTSQQSRIAARHEILLTLWRHETGLRQGYILKVNIVSRELEISRIGKTGFCCIFLILRRPFMSLELCRITNRTYVYLQNLSDFAIPSRLSHIFYTQNSSVSLFNTRLTCLVGKP